MKKTVLLLCLVLFSFGIQTSVLAKVVNVITPGTLRTFFNPVEKVNVTDLIVTGTIDVRDFKFMRDTLKVLSSIDLSGVTVQGYVGSDGTMLGTNINYPANELPDNAFMSKPTLVSIVLPSSITSIGGYCFMSCNKLAGTITIPNSVTSIGDFAFQICQNITGLVLGNSVKSIGKYSFALCNKLSGVVSIPNSTISIGQAAFQYCSAINEINIGTSIVSLGQYPFLDCTGLTKITIANQTPPTVLSNTFQGVNKTAVSIVVPSSSIIAYQSANYWKDFITIVGGASSTLTKTLDVAAAGTLNSLLTATEKSTITNLTLTGIIDARDVKCMRNELAVLGVLNISDVNINAYSGFEGTQITFTTFPANEMPANSFFDNDRRPSVSKTSLTSIIFPSTITSIGDQAFFQCIGLSGNLVIPSSVNNIGNSAFQDCRGITGTLILPNSLTTIKNCAFGWCSGLTELVLGLMVSSIESEAFTDCSGLTKVTVARSSPPIIASNSFGFDKTNCTLYVPIGTSSAYKSAEYWSDFLLISEKNLSTSTVNNRANKIKIFNTKSMICIEGTSENEVVNIYTIAGKLIRTIKSQGEILSIPMPLGNIYLVKTNLKIQKIIM